jgi:hypothetical protein
LANRPITAPFDTGALNIFVSAQFVDKIALAFKPGDHAV